MARYLQDIDDLLADLPVQSSAPRQGMVKVVLPAPYNINTEVTIANYKDQIEFLFKRKNVPAQLTQSVIKDVAKSISRNTTQPNNNLNKTVYAEPERHTLNFSVNRSIDNLNRSNSKEKQPFMNISFQSTAYLNSSLGDLNNTSTFDVIPTNDTPTFFNKDYNSSATKTTKMLLEKNTTLRIPRQPESSFPASKKQKYNSSTYLLSSDQRYMLPKRIDYPQNPRPDELYTRLNRQTTHECKKKCQHTHIPTHIKKELENQLQMKSKPTIIKKRDHQQILNGTYNRDSFKGLKSVSSEQNKLKMGTSHRGKKLHQALYDLCHKRRPIPQPDPQCTFHPTLLKTPNHIKTSEKDFMQRMKDEIQNRRSKEEFMQLKHYINFESNQEMFRPKIVTPKQFRHVQPRVFEYRDRSVEVIKRSLSKDSMESKIDLNKSTEIVREKEWEYFEDIESKLSKDEETVAVDESTIGKLDEQEFKIIYPFLASIEDLPLQKEEFKDKFQKFFKGLPITDKHALKFLSRKKKDGHRKHVGEGQGWRENRNCTFKPQLNQESLSICDNYLERLKNFV